MSELTDVIDTTLQRLEDRGISDTEYIYTLGRASLAKDVADLLPAHEAEIIERAKEEQMEADCSAACYWWGHDREGDVYPVEICRIDSRPQTWIHRDGVGHRVSECGAEFIRNAWAKARPEARSNEAAQ